MERDEAGIQRFVEHLGGLYEASGMARLPARLMARFLIDEDGRMTSAEIAEQLQVSPAAVSSATKVLIQVGLIRKERQPGTRANAYVLVDDDWYGSLMRQDQTLLLHEQYLQDGIDAAGGYGTRAGQRLALSVDQFILLRKHLDAFQREWDALKLQRSQELAALDARQA